MAARWSLPLLLLISILMVGADFRDLSPSEQIRVMRSEDRVALVIGNGAYRGAPLANAPRDARMVAAALKTVGFEVTLRENLAQRDMQRALVDFGHALEAGGVGVFYYAGHGIQYHGRNYLVPTDSVLTRPDDLEIYGIEADAVLAKMVGSGNRLNIVILDACRNDPFERGGGGLALMDARGTFLAYASGAGRAATDEGVYARSLSQQLTTPGARLWEVFERVGAEVERATQGTQSPWVGSNARGEFYFVLPVADEQIGSSESSPSDQPPAGTKQPGATPAFERLVALESEIEAELGRLRAEAERAWQAIEPFLARYDEQTATMVTGWLDKWGQDRATVRMGGVVRELEAPQEAKARAWLARYQKVSARENARLHSSTALQDRLTVSSSGVLGWSDDIPGWGIDDVMFLTRLGCELRTLRGNAWHTSLDAGLMRHASLVGLGGGYRWFFWGVSERGMSIGPYASFSYFSFSAKDDAGGLIIGPEVLARIGLGPSLVLEGLVDVSWTTGGGAVSDWISVAGGVGLGWRL